MSRIIAVTGAAGYIGKKLIPYLHEKLNVDHFVGFDIRNLQLDPQIPINFYKKDIRGSFSKILEENGVTDLIHLAWTLNPLRNVKKAYQADIEGTENILKETHKANVQYFLHTSSTLAYGAYEDNPYPLVEENTLRGNSDFHYAHHKAIAEKNIEIMKRNTSEFDIKIGIIRPSPILSTDLRSYVTEILMGGWRTFFLLPYPNKKTPIQFLHINDALNGFLFMIKNRLEGVYNLTPDSDVKIGDIPHILEKEKRGFQVSLQFLKKLLGIQWFLHLSKVPPSYLDFVAYSFVASNAKFKKEGFFPQYTTKEALLSLLSTSKNKL